MVVFRKIQQIVNLQKLNQVPGKTEVVRLNGQTFTFWGSLERSTGYTASAALLGLGFFQYFWERNCQTTHDKITETIVIEN